MLHLLYKNDRRLIIVIVCPVNNVPRVSMSLDQVTRYNITCGGLNITSNCSTVYFYEMNHVVLFS
jgi:hypothetical protein